MRVEFAAFDPAVRVYRPAGTDVVFVDPSTPAEDAVLLVSMAASTDAVRARAMLDEARARHGVPQPRAPRKVS